MVAPTLTRVNESDARPESRVGGWLLLLCLILLFGQPISLAFGVSAALQALSLRGLPLALVMIARILVAAFGIGAGISLMNGRPGSAALARWSIGLSAAMDTFVYVTPFYPNNRTPGTTPIFVFATLAYYGSWFVYLLRSKRIR